MPSVSKKQHAAMCAAAKGKSTIGIPKEIGMEYCSADRGKKFAKHNATNRMKVRALRECKSHDACVVAQMEEPEREKKSKSPEVTTDFEPRAIADHHVPAKEGHLYQPGAMVDLHAVPVDQEGDEPAMKKGESRSARRERMAERLAKMEE